MTLLAFLAVSAAGCFVSALAPGRRLAQLAGVVALAVALGAALSIRPGDAATVGDVRLVPTWFAGVFVTACLTASLLISVLGLTAETPRGFAPAALATAALFGVALSAADPGAALFAAAAAAAPALSVATVGGGTTAASEVRTLVLIGVATFLAAACGLAAAWTSDVALAAPAAAYVLLAAAIAVRSGSVPFHVPAARVARERNPLVLALVLVWVPAGLGAIALAWTEGISVRDGSALPTTPVLVLAVATILLGALAALLHRDLAEIAAYSVVQDSGFLLLALAAHAGAPAGPARLWLVCFVLGKTALAAWVAAMTAGFGTRNLPDLPGWARQMPLLALGLAVSAVATVGWPGLAVFEARTDLVEAAIAAPFAAVAALAAALSLAVYGRVLAYGLLARTATVSLAPAERPRWKLPRSRARTHATRALAAQPPVRSRFAAGVHKARDGASHISQLARANVVPARSALVLATALLAAGVAAGGFGAPSAASSDWALTVEATAAPTLAAPDDLLPPPSDDGRDAERTLEGAPSLAPSDPAAPESQQPSAAGSPEPSAPESPQPSGSASPSPSAGASAS